MRRPSTFFTATLIGLLTGCSASDPAADPFHETGELPLIPYPASLKRVERAFRFREGLSVGLALSLDTATVRTGMDGLRSRLDMPLTLSKESRGAGHIEVRAVGADRVDHPEGYRLSVTPARILIEARGEVGAFHAFQTLRQAVRASPGPGGTGWEVGCLEIQDHPRFAWRGMHMDVARHFFPVSDVKAFIDLMADCKLNRLHWHLTDDQGWRIEIKKWPRLTSVGAWRDGTPVLRDPDRIEPGRHGGFYTQEEIREVVAYARARAVEVMPEIDVPAHAQAALAAYPEFGVSKEPVAVATRWSGSRSLFDVDEASISFLCDVLGEVTGLFPFEFVHIGFDEAPMREWRHSESAMRLAEEKGFTRGTQIQTYLAERLIRFLGSRGKRAVGWEEILQDGLPSDAVVMVWRRREPALEALRRGHDVVLCPRFPCYLSDTPRPGSGLQDIYAFDPSLEAAGAGKVLGAQGCLWTENIRDWDALLDAAVPRMHALAEVLWSPRGCRSLEDFRERLEGAARRRSAPCTARTPSPSPR